MKDYGTYNGPRNSEFWALKYGHNEHEFVNYLWNNDVPFKEVNGVYKLKPEVKSALENAGWEFELHEIFNIGKLPFEERNKIRRDARSPEIKKRALEKLRSKYGNLMRLNNS